MIAHLLPRYYEHYSNSLRYDVLRSVVIDGHEVAWMSYVGTVQVDLMDEGREGNPFIGRTMKCECDFTEGIGWSVDTDGHPLPRSGPDTHETCLIRHAALHLRHLELRQEYKRRFVDGNANFFLGLRGYIREITLDMIEKGRAGEWLEGTSGASLYGGYFYLQTLAAIIDQPMGYLWEDMHLLMEEKLIDMDGAIIKSYTKPPPPRWEECLRIEDKGWTGVALLPGDRQMAQEWKFQVFNPSCEKQRLYAPGRSLLHDPILGPDTEDVERARQSLLHLIGMCRQQN